MGVRSAMSTALRATILDCPLVVARLSRSPDHGPSPGIRGRRPASASGSSIAAPMARGVALRWRGLVASSTSRTRRARRVVGLAVPLLFGAFLLFLWEVIVVGLGVPFGAAAARRPRSRAASWRSLPTLRADFVQTFLKAVSVRLRHRLRLRASLVAIARRPRAVPAPRPAAARQFRLGAADHRHRADHGDVVRLRLAVEGGRGRGDDLLPDAGEHGRRARRGRRAWSAT